MNWQKADYMLSTDKNNLNLYYIHEYLSKQSYWAGGIPFEVVKKSIEGSLCFGLYHGKTQMGFARVITDCATFAYLADVFIDVAHRGLGLSKWLIETIINHPDLHGLRRFILATRDAHGLYARYGFAQLDNPDRWMEIRMRYEV